MTNNLHSARKMLILGIFVLLLGCIPTLDKLDEDTLQKSSTATPKNTPIKLTTLPSVTVSPTLSASPTLIETLPQRSTATSSKTISPTPSLTRTTIPSLPPNGAKQVVQGLYENNGGCELPCWWKILPGTTTLDEARTIISPISKELGYWNVGRKNVLKFAYSIPVPEGGLDPYNLGSFEIFLWAENNIVIAIGTNISRIQRDIDYSLPGLLGLLGQPDEIWISAHSQSQDNNPPYDLELFYSNKGVLLSSKGKAIVTDDFIDICPQEFRWGKYPPTVILFSPNDQFTYQEITETIHNREVSHIFVFRLLRDLTDGFDETDFYRTYTDPNAETCINIQLDRLQ